MFKEEYLAQQKEAIDNKVEYLLKYQDFLTERKELRKIIGKIRIKDKILKFKYELIEMFIISMGMIGSYSYLKFFNEKTTDKDYYKLLFPLCTQISNNFISTVKLAYDGMNFQADNLMRTNYELLFHLMACLIDENKMGKYLNTGEDEVENYKLWREEFTFSKLNKTISDFSTEPYFNEYFKGLYSRYSNYCHVEFLHCLIRCTTPDIKDKERVLYNLWGNNNALFYTYLNNMTELIGYSTGNIVEMLQRKKDFLDMDKNLNITYESKYLLVILFKIIYKNIDILKTD